MTQDLNKRISSIQYNLLNLPQNITFSTGSTIAYTHDAEGRKLNVTYGSPSKTINYSGNMVYENGTLKQILTEGGYVTFSGSTPVHHAYLKDHQGNNRVVINSSGTIEQVNHYYPFGYFFGESTNASTQRYKYNDKEFDMMHGLHWYDYGARHYDPAIMRFTTMDPMCEKYYHLSPYAYCGNNPVNNIDIKGDSILVLIAPDGANGNGHMAVLIQNKENRWEYYSKNGTKGLGGLYGEPYNDNKGESSFSSVDDFLNSSEFNPVDKETNQRKYTEGYLIPATSIEDTEAINAAMSELNKIYNVFGSNCAVTVQKALSAAGKFPGIPTGFSLSAYSDNIVPIIDYIIRSKVPNHIYQQIKATNHGIIVKPRK